MINLVWPLSRSGCIVVLIFFFWVMINFVWQLTRSGWAPIAKISFMTYLVHMDIQFIFFRMQASFANYLES